MAAPSKALLLTVAGGVAAAIVVYFAMFSGSDSAPTEPRPTQPTETSRPAPPPQPVTAEAPRASDERQFTGAAVPTSAGGVEGTVRDPSLQPLAGATVELRKAPTNNILLNAAGGLQRGADSGPVYTAKSGVDGKYRIQAPTGEGWKLVARHPDYAPVEFPNVSTPAEGFLTFDLPLVAGIRMYGRVTEDASARPLEGCLVILDGPATAQAGFARPVMDRREGRTDTSGAFKFENVASGQHTLSFLIRGYGRVERNNVMVPPDPPDRAHREDVRLKEAKSISGRVVDTQGHGVAKAKVTASTSGPSGSYGETLTAENGDYVVTDIEDNRYYLSADAAGYGLGRAEQPVAAGSVDVTITLTPRGAAQGLVRERGSKRPVTSFSVEVRRASGNAKQAMRVQGPLSFRSNDGSFEVGGMDPQFDHVLVVTADGFASAQSEKFRVQPGQVARGIEILLPLGGTISGRVVDAKTQKPVAGATVRTRDNDWSDLTSVPLLGPFIEATQTQRATERSATTDGEGRFELANVAAEDGVVQLDVRHPSYTALPKTGVTVTEGGKTDVGTLGLLSGGTIQGVVYETNNTPAAGAEVHVQKTDFGPGKSLTSRQTRTDSQGRFLVKGLPAGEYRVSASRAGAGGQPANPFLSIRERQVTQQMVTLGEGASVEHNVFLPGN